MSGSCDSLPLFPDERCAAARGVHEPCPVLACLSGHAPGMVCMQASLELAALPEPSPEELAGLEAELEELILQGAQAVEITDLNLKVPPL